MKLLAHRRSGASTAVLFLLTIISTVLSFSPIVTKISPRIGADIATCRRLGDDGPSKRHGRNIACFEPPSQHKKDDVVAIFAAASIMVSTLVGVPLPALSATDGAITTTATNTNNNDVQGIAAITKSELGQTVRRSVIGSAQLADNIDLKWERFSDSLRDERKCDPRTNRRMFDNGTRKDGTKIGNPVLGALCTPEPLKALNVQFAASIADLAQQAMKETTSDFRIDDLQRKESQIKEKVGAAFDRAVVKNTASVSSEDDETAFEELKKRLEFNRDLYIRMRAYGELVQSKNTMNNNRETARAVEKLWGHNILASLAPNANRHDYISPFPKPDPTDDQPYDEGALLDALGAVSVALNKLQEGGLIGHWEISIPEDDYWNVVTIAVDDDVSIGGQILSRESNQPLRGSAVVAMVRSAMEEMAKLNYKIDTFFIDPTTTRQELYNPTQLLVSLSDLGQ